MQFIAEGPDIPLEILRAQEEGRLVLFCGAGISIPAGLPSFKSLVEKVYEGLGAIPSKEEKKELSGPSYDRVLNLLEGPRRFSAGQVRRQVARILATPADPLLDTHRAILNLSRDRHGRLRLVTTNFDGLFQAAEPEAPFTAAPLLPVPKLHKWNQLVYLHGRLDPEDPDGVHLILTSADFGMAYLVERWAARFVSELFRHCTVLFVGYAVDDPPMRYLIDAMAAERRLDDRLHPAFALTGYPAEKREEEEAGWTARGITPILYDTSHGHALLHRTIKEWGRIWAGGLSSKLSIVTDLAQKDPETLPTEALSQFCWAVSDESGSMAMELARPGRSANLGWLEVLETNRILTGPALSGSAVSVGLVDDGRTTERVPSLDALRRGLAAWLSEHAGDPKLARWVLKKGGRLHVEFQDLIRRRLHDVPALPPILRKVWLALTGSVRLQRRSDAYDRLGFHGRLRQEEWGPALRREVLAALAPCLKVHPSWTSPLGQAEGEEEEEIADTVGSILSFDCELEAGASLQLMLDTLAGRPDWSAILPDLAFDLTHLLREALDFHAILGAASETYDPSHIQHASILLPELNHYFHGWTRLIELVRQAHDALRTHFPERAKTLVSVWSSIPYPLFRRFVLYAAHVGGYPSGQELLETLAREPRYWLWSTGTQAELFSILPRLWSTLDDPGRTQLASLLLEGPPRDMFRADLAPNEWNAVRDYAIWERLARLARGGVVLNDNAASELARIEAANPEWRLTGALREDIPHWVETGCGLRTDFPSESLLALGDDELIRILQQHKSNRAGLLDSWHEAAKRDRSRAIRLLVRLLDEGYVDLGVWSHGLAAFHEFSEDPDLKRDFLGLLGRLPAAILCDEKVLRPAAEAIRSIARAVPDLIRSQVLVAWDALFAYALPVEARSSDERVTDAINHPAGILTEALFHVLRSRPLERDSGIETDIRLRLERIVEAEGSAAALARVLVASRLPLLHDLDSEWTRRVVVALLDWGNPDEARCAWQGFLRSPWVRPSLWVAIKPAFLGAFDHIDSLGRSKENLAALLAAMAIEGEDALSPFEGGKCLRKLGIEGRQIIANLLWQKLRDTGPQAPTLWRESIGPWLARAWPREPDLRNAGSSKCLAWATTVTGEAFTEAVHCVSELIGPIEDADGILEDLHEKGLSTTFPETCLGLINSLTPDQPSPWFGALSDFLERLRRVRPGLAEDLKFQRLHNIAIRSRL